MPSGGELVGVAMRALRDEPRVDVVADRAPVPLGALRSAYRGQKTAARSCAIVGGAVLALACGARTVEAAPIISVGHQAIYFDAGMGMDALHAPTQVIGQNFWGSHPTFDIAIAAFEFDSSSAVPTPQVILRLTDSGSIPLSGSNLTTRITDCG